MADHRCGVPIMNGRQLGGLRAKPSLVLQPDFVISLVRG
jgi:hypothetical protein